MNDMLSLSPAHAPGFVPKTLVIANAHWIAELAKDDMDDVSELTLYALAADATPPDGRLGGFDLIVLEIDADQSASLDRIGRIKQMLPEATIIAAVGHADMAVMRALLVHGVSDVVSLPFDSRELVSKVYSIGAQSAVRENPALAPSLCFVGSIGRTGTSSILLHLAAALAEDAAQPMRICIIDLDLQAGQLAVKCGVESPRSIQDLLEAESRLDNDMVRNVASRVTEGVYLIPAPAEIEPIEKVQIDQLFRIITIARTEFDLVLLDIPKVWTDWSLSVAAEASQIILITEQSLAHLRQGKRIVNLFRDVGIDKGKIQVIVNRAQKSRFRSIGVDDVASALSCDVTGTVRDDRGELQQAADEGVLVSALSRRNQFYADIRQIASDLGDQLRGLRS